MFAIYKAAEINWLVQGGQLYCAFRLQLGLPGLTIVLRIGYLNYQKYERISFKINVCNVKSS
jgi:hypothetical protein